MLEFDVARKRSSGEPGLLCTWWCLGNVKNSPKKNSNCWMTQKLIMHQGWTDERRFICKYCDFAFTNLREVRVAKQEDRLTQGRIVRYPGSNWWWRFSPIF